MAQFVRIPEVRFLFLGKQWRIANRLLDRCSLRTLDVLQSGVVVSRQLADNPLWVHHLLCGLPNGLPRPQQVAKTKSEVGRAPLDLVIGGADPAHQGLDRLRDEHSAEKAGQVVVVSVGGCVTPDADKVGTVLEKVSVTVIDHETVTHVEKTARASVPEKQYGFVLRSCGYR